MKNCTKLLCCVCMAVVAVLSSCKKDNPPLAVAFDDAGGGRNLIEQGQTLDLPFTVSGTIEGEIKVSATGDNPDFTVSASLNSSTTGVVTVTAPQVIYSPSTLKISLKAEDAVSLQTATAEASVSVGMAESYTEITKPANCYIVAPGAFVKFPANIGNTSAKADFTTADLLWQDAKGLVTKVTPDTEGGTIYALLGEGLSGNAVIAAKNAEGAIVWSWHLWVSDYNPDANVMLWTSAATDTPASTTYNIMDRSLGALSATAGTDASNGCFYQWGRKDPFPGSTYENSLKPMYDMAGEEVTKVIEAVAVENNIANSIANPLTHYSGVSGGNWSWLTTSYTAVSEIYKDLWGGSSGNKSQYDPCPDGWKVIPLAAFGFISDANVTRALVHNPSVETPANKDVYGRTFTIGASTFYLASQGEIQHAGSFTNGIGSTWPNGKVWSANVDETGTGSSYFRARALSNTPTSLGTGSGLGFGYALPVRCIKE